MSHVCPSVHKYVFPCVAYITHYAGTYITSWYTKKMVAQNMLRTYDVKKVFSEKIGFDDQSRTTTTAVTKAAVKPRQERFMDIHLQAVVSGGAGGLHTK